MSSRFRLAVLTLALLCLASAVHAQVEPAHWYESSPPARIEAVALYDSAADQVLLRGGAYGGYSTSLFELPSWRLRMGAANAWERWEVPPQSGMTQAHCVWIPERRELWQFPRYFGPYAVRQGVEPGSSREFVPVENSPSAWLGLAFDARRDRFVGIRHERAWPQRDTIALYAAPLADTLRFQPLEVRGVQPNGIYPQLQGWDDRGSAFVMSYSTSEPPGMIALFADDDPRWEDVDAQPDPAAGRPSADYVPTPMVRDPASSDLYTISISDGSVAQDYRAKLWRLERSATPRWVQLRSPPNLGRGGALTVDSRRRRLVYHGGGIDRGIADATTHFYDIATGTWETMAPPSEPEPRASYAIAYDHARDRALMFGGTGLRTLGLLRDLWARNSADGTWTRLEPEGDPPPPRANAFLVEDLAHARFLLLGGWMGTPSAPDLWALTTSGSLSWSRIETGGVPPDRVDGAFLDPRRDRLVVYGAVSQPFQVGEWELPLRGEARWRRLPVAGPDIAPQGAGFVHDHARDRALLFGGVPAFNAPALEFGCLWSFRLDADSVRWERLSDPNGSITAQYYRLWNTGCIVVDPVRDRLISNGGLGYLNGPSPGLGYEPIKIATACSLLEGGGWSTFEAVTGMPPPMSEQPLVYDPVRDAVWFFGGNGTSSSVFELEGGYEGWPVVEARAVTTLEPAVQLEWVAPPGVQKVAVMRRRVGEEWRYRGPSVRGSDGVFRFTDASVAAHATLRYRLSWPVPGGHIPVGEVTVTTQVPEMAAVRLRSNPTVSTVKMDLDLPQPGEVHVQLLDIAGRLVSEKRFTTSAAGRRPFELGGLGALDPGLYFVRVQSAAGIATARVSFLR